MFWRLKRLFEHLAYSTSFQVRGMSERLIGMRSRLRMQLAPLAPRQLIPSVGYYLNSLAFGHRRKQFVLTFMAIFLTGCCAVVLSCGMIAARDRVIEHYGTQAFAATNDGDHRAALDYWQWIIWLDGPKSENRLQLADAFDRVGMGAERDAILAELVPDNRHGYPPAHLVLIRRDVRADDLSPKRLASMLRELDWLSEHELDRSQIDELRVACLLRSGRLSEAWKILDRPSTIDPSIRMLAARTFASLDIRKAATSQAQVARRNLVEQLAKNETVAKRLLLAEAEGILGNVRAIEETLRVGAALHPRGPFALELARLHLQLGASPALTSEQRNVVLDGGIRLASRAPGKASQRAEVLWGLYLARGDVDRATIELAMAAEGNAGKRLDLARFEVTHGGMDTAHAVVSAVANDCRSRIAASPHGRSARLQLAEASVLLRDYETAIRTLTEAWQELQDPEYAVALSRTYIARFDMQLRETQCVSAEDVALLEHASGYCPASIELAKRLRKARELVTASNTAVFERIQVIARMNYAAANDVNL